MLRARGFKSADDIFAAAESGQIGARCVGGNGLAVIMLAFGDHGPTVITARLHEVQFVTPGGAMFEIPQPPLIVEGEAENVAMPV